MIPVPNIGQRGVFGSPLAAHVGLMSSGCRDHFAVSNSYVMNKLRLLLFPFLHRDWNTEFRKPRDDLNAPDLYIPMMAFITWIIVSFISLATKTSSSPADFGKLASRGLSVVFVEVIFLKCYLRSDALLVIVAWSGYKFIGACINILSFLIFGNALGYAVLSYNTISSAFVMCRQQRVVLLSPFSLFMFVSQIVWAIVLCT